MNAKSFLLISVLCFSLISAQPPNKKSSFKIVGYYSLKAAVAGDQKEPPFDQLTHINLWFLNPDSVGNFTSDLSGLIPFVKAAHRKNVKVLFSMGGGSRQDQYHHLLQDDKRPALIDSLVAVVLRYDLDGVDVDLEGSNIDENYEKFVVELAATLKTHNKLISAAIAIYYKDQFTDKALAQYDFVNVMSYDRTGPWAPEKPGPHSLYEHAVEDLKYFGEIRNIPAAKMTLGVPFYGYGYGPEISSPAISMNFGEIVTAFPGAELVDEWSMPGGKIIYYNGMPTMKQKVKLAREKASGIMIWQIQGDAEGDKSLLKVINKEGRKKK